MSDISSACKQMWNKMTCMKLAWQFIQHENVLKHVQQLKMKGMVIDDNWCQQVNLSDEMSANSNEKEFLRDKYGLTLFLTIAW